MQQMSFYYNDKWHVYATPHKYNHAYPYLPFNVDLLSKLMNMFFI